MSVDSSVYFGVYLRVKKEFIQKDIVAYKNKEGEIFSDYKFDPKTGEKFTEVILKEKVKIIPDEHIDFDEIDEDHRSKYRGLNEEEFLKLKYHSEYDDYSYFTLNCSLRPPYAYSIDFEELLNVEFNEVIDPNKIIADFEKEYERYLDYYRDYKKYDFEVKYGLISYSY